MTKVSYGSTTDYIAENIDFDGDKYEIAEYLLAWYNVCEPDQVDLDLLIDLVNTHKVSYFECPKCHNAGYKAEPDNWLHFQGVWQGDDVEGFEIEVMRKSISVCQECYENFVKLINP